MEPWSTDGRDPPGEAGAAEGCTMELWPADGREPLGVCAGVVDGRVVGAVAGRVVGAVAPGRLAPAPPAGSWDGVPDPEPQPRASRVPAAGNVLGAPEVRKRFWSGCHFCPPPP